MTFKFYKYAGKRLAYNKASALANLTPITITSDRLQSNQNLESPTILIDGGTYDLTEYTYVYIQEWQRYYFISSRMWIGEDILQIDLEEDYLYTWAAKLDLAGTSGVARYSGLGYASNIDPRLGFFDVPTVTSSATNITVGTTLYALRFYSYGGNNYGSEAIALMVKPLLYKLLYKIMDLPDAERVLVCRSLIDITEVHYLNLQSIYNNLDAYSNLVFCTPGKVDDSWSIQTYKYVDISFTQQELEGYAFHIILQPDDVKKLSYVRIESNATVTSGDFWELQANWEFLIPYAGSVSFKPADTGYYTITYTAFDVSYEPFENSYVIIPFINDSLYYPAMQVLPVRTTLSFPIDTTYSNASLTNTSNMLTMAMGMLGGAGLLASGNPTGLLSIAQSGVSAYNNYQNIQMREAMGFSFKGNMGGVPALTSLITGSKIYWFKFQKRPISNVAGFRSALGYTDGNYRTLASLSGTGYAQVDVHDIDGVVGINSNEIATIKNLLSGGVYF